MSNLQNRQNSKILAAFYIVCFALAVVLDSGFGSSNAKAITLVTVILAAAVIFITADFISFMKKHRQLEILKDNISVSNEHMPQPSNVIEKDYQELIIALTEDNKKKINEV